MEIKRFKKFNESISDIPDWFSGSDFGVDRRVSKKTIDKYSNIPTRIQNKIDSFEKKKSIIMSKWELDNAFKVTVKRHVMSKSEKVDPREAIKLCDQAIDRLRTNKSDAGGIIIYVR